MDSGDKSNSESNTKCSNAFVNNNSIENVNCMTASKPDVVDMEDKSITNPLIDSRKNCDRSSGDLGNKRSILNNNDLAIGFVDDDDETNDAIALNHTINNDGGQSNDMGE